MKVLALVIALLAAVAIPTAYLLGTDVGRHCCQTQGHPDHDHPTSDERWEA